MRLFLIFFLSGLLFTSCENEKPDYQKLIQGNWECDYVNEDGDTTLLNLYFKDSVCFFDWCRNEKNKYIIKGNAIKITTYSHYRRHKKENHYLRIAGCNNGILKVISDKSWFNSNYEVDMLDTLIFRETRTRIRNHFKKASVVLASRGDWRPYFLQIEILQDRSVKIQCEGNEYFKLGYCYSGKLKQSTYNLLLDEINSLDFHNWKEDYEGCCDAGNNYLLFKLDGKKYKVHVYGDQDNPEGISNLISFLQLNMMNIHWNKELSKDCEFYYWREINRLVYGSELGQIKKTLQFIPPN